MIVERDVDCGALYERTRLGLVGVLRGMADEVLATVVPATPAWSVRDALAHVIGIAADLNANRFPTGDADEWTADQVEQRRSHSIEQLVAEWEREAPIFADGLRLFGYETGCHFLGDLVQHSVDVHHALGLTMALDDDVRTSALDHYLNAFHEALLLADVGGVLATIGEHEWMLGVDPIVATWTVEPLEGLRALGGRRSEAQLRRSTWTGDLDAVIGLVSPYGLPAEDLVDGSSPRM